MSSNYKCEKIEDWDQIAKQILSTYPNEKLFVISGSMGAGKTTLVKSLCAYLKVEDAATSPTYSIINEYKIRSNSKPVFHMDFYRLNSLLEALDLGCEEFFFSDCFCFIEWPEIIETLLPLHYVEVRISKSEKNTQTRNIQTNMV